MSVQVNRRQCAACGCCVGLCPVGALSLDEFHLHVEPTCNECGICVAACPTGALSLGQESHALISRPLRARYDLIVVGAGPAGSMAAWTAAKAGVSVLLLEKRQEIGSPVRCAEGVGRSALQAILEPQPRWIAATVSRAEIIAMTEDKPLRLFNQGSEGYVLERRVFDRELAEQAAIAGAEVRVKCPVVGLLMEGQRVVGVRARLDDIDHEIEAAVVIGADGVESWVGRWAGLTGPLPAHEYMTCAQYLLAGVDIDPHCLQFWVLDHEAPGGYVWAFPKGDGKANVGLGIQADMAQEPPLAVLNRFIESQPALARGSAVTLITGGVPVTSMPARLVGDGVMLVGDAARQVDPLTGGGIISAMIAGRLAGQVAAEAIEAGAPDAAHLSSYEQAWNHTLGRRLARNYRLRQRFPPAQRASRDFLRVFAVAISGG